MMNTPGSNSSNSSNNKRSNNLLSSAAAEDWSAHVVTALPQAVVQHQQDEQSSSSSLLLRPESTKVSCGPWSCLAVPNHQDHGSTTSTSTSTSGYHLLVWHASERASWTEQKQAPVLKLQHEKLQNEESLTTATTRMPPLLAMHTSHSSTSTSTSSVVCWLLCANPVSGALLVYKLQGSDFARVLPPRCTAMTLVDLQPEGGSDHHDRMQDDDHDDALTCLTLDWPRVALGTAQGRVYTGHVRAVVPAAVVLQPVQAPVPAASLFSSLLFTPKKKKKMPRNKNATSSMHLVQVLWTSDTTGVGVTRAGRLVPWSGTQLLHNDDKEHNDDDTWLARLLQPRLDAGTLASVQAATITGTGMLHLLVHTDTPSEPTLRQRLYWVVLAPSNNNNKSAPLFALHALHWIGRVADPTAVHVDLVGTVRQAHAVLVTTPAVLLCVHDDDDEQGGLQEMDLSPDLVLLPGTLAPDVRTAGVTVWDASGVALLVQCRRDPPSVATSATTSKPSAARVATLASHWKSAFWQAYLHPDEPPQLPPSLTHTTTSTTPDTQEAALLQAAHDLASQLTLQSISSSLVDTGRTTAHISEWHFGFLRLLQQTGRYRSLSLECRWRLLAIGQQVAVLQALETFNKNATTVSAWQEEQWNRLVVASANPQNHRRHYEQLTSFWLEQVQESALQEGSGQEAQVVFLQWLLLGMEAAMAFRTDKAFVYDVHANKLPVVDVPDKVPVWTSQAPLLQVWTRQFLYWQTKSRSTANEGVLKKASQLALQSFGDAYESCRSTATKLAYVTAQRVTLALVRNTMLRQDLFAFGLCKQHKYFHGLCEIAMDHEDCRDRVSFDLIPLMTELASLRDTESNLPFPAYCIRWHADRQCFGHALQYGSKTPEVLAQLVHNLDALKPYKWIHAIRKGDYEGATLSLMDNANLGNHTNQNTTESLSSSSSLTETKLVLSMARITNQIVEEEIVSSRETAAKRRRLLEKQSEVLSAQQVLLGPTADAAPVKSRETLLQYALEQLQQATATDKLELAVTALALCSSYPSDREVRESAVRVWAHVLDVDRTVWHKLVATESTDLTSPRNVAFVRDHTLFGAVFEETRDQDAWDAVAFDANMEARVLERLATHQDMDDDESTSTWNATAGLRRLLRSVTAEEGQISRGMTGESLLSQSF